MCSKMTLFLLILALCWPLYAAEDVYEPGKLVNIYIQEAHQRAYYKTPKIASIASYYFVVETKDFVYTGHCSSFSPRDWLVGNPVEIRIEERMFYLKKPNGEEKSFQLDGIEKRQGMSTR